MSDYSTTLGLVHSLPVVLVFPESFEAVWQVKHFTSVLQVFRVYFKVVSSVIHGCFIVIKDCFILSLRLHSGCFNGALGV